MSEWNNPGMSQVGPTPPVAPRVGPLPWLLAELVDHLLPWSREFAGTALSIKALSVALAVAVTVVWGLGAAGQVGHAAILGWWAGWCVAEVWIRMRCKPYVKEGPWWGRRYRAANLMDMIAYVCFKNLLIGASLFVALKAAGLLVG